MTFVNRGHVESTGRFGVSSVKDCQGIRAFQLNSFWLYLDEEDHGYTKHALGDGYWESWITYWMDNNVSPEMTVLDIGANHGYYSFFLASKGCEVHAYEPQPELAELIRQSEEFNELGVYVHEVAVSDRSGKTSMMVPVHHGMNATISNEFSYAPDGYGSIEVETIRLDDLAGEQVDFIKVDAEGAEDLIWAGSKEFRATHPNTIWLMEWRWDRYKNPEEFAAEVLDNHRVTHVDYDGVEYPITSVEHLATRRHEDWMLVLR